MTTQEKLNHLTTIIHSDEFDVLFDEISGIDNIGGEENYRNLVNEYTEDLDSFSDLDAYDDDEDVFVMVTDFILYCEDSGNL